VSAEIVPSVRVTFYARWWHALRTAFSPEIRQMTAAEFLLSRQLANVREELSNALAAADAQRLEVQKLQAQLQVAELEIGKLTDVAARDRMRVQAESAAYARQIAEATGHASAGAVSSNF
jgi:hypothetical protein